MIIIESILIWYNREIKMKNKWNIVDVNSSKTIKSLRDVVAEFDTLEECEKFISRSKMENLAIREAR